MTKLITYSGNEPSETYPPAALDTGAVLRLMEKQLEILGNMTQRIMLVPAGTKLTEERDI